MRKIQEIEPPSPLKIQAVYNDSYLRPAGNNSASSLEQIERSLQSWLPTAQQKLKEQAKEKELTDTSAGIALYHMLGGEDLPFKDAKAKMQSGKIDQFKSGAKQLTQDFANGYYRARTANLAMQIDAGMKNWESADITTDENGKQISISSITDMEQLTATYKKKEAELIETLSGGKVDPRYFATLVVPVLEKSEYQFIENQSNIRAKTMLDRNTKEFGHTLNLYMDRMIKNNEFILDDTEHTPQRIAEDLQSFSIGAKANGLPEYMVYEELTKMLTSVMYDYDIDNIDGIKEVAKLLPIWNDPQQRGIIEQASKNAREGKIRSDRDKEYARKLEDERKIGSAFTELLQKYDYEPSGIPWTEWKNILAIAPEAVEHVTSLQSAFNRYHSNSVEQQYSISDEKFYSLYGDFASGKKGIGSLINLSGKIAPRQLKDLTEAYNSRQSIVKSATGGSSSNSKDESYSKIKSKALKMLGGNKEDMSYEEKVLLDNVAGQIAYNVARQAQGWKNKNKEADNVDYDFAVDGFITDNVTKYGANLDVYKEDPNTLRNDPVKTRQKTLENNANDILGLFPKKNQTVREMLERIETSKGKVSFSKQEIKNINKLLKGTEFEGKAERLISQLVEISREL